MRGGQSAAHSPLAVSCPQYTISPPPPQPAQNPSALRAPGRVPALGNKIPPQAPGFWAGIPQLCGTHPLPPPVRLMRYNLSPCGTGGGFNSIILFQRRELTLSRLPARALVASGDRSAPTEPGGETGRWTHATGTQRPLCEPPLSWQASYIEEVSTIWGVIKGGREPPFGMRL